MRLVITEGDGVTVWTMHADDGTGRSDSIVTDPRNETRPDVSLATWIADTGGTAPIGGTPCPAGSSGRGSIGSADNSSN